MRILGLIVTLAPMAWAFAACGDNGTGNVGDGSVVDVTQKEDVSTQPADAAKDVFDAAPTDAPANPWPDCKTQPQGVPTKTISDLWNDNPSTPEQVWLSGVYVTAISSGSCQAGGACEFIVQQDLTYASLAAGAHNAIREWVTSPTAQYFSTLQVGDQLNMLAWAYRESGGGQNELITHVDTIEPGCALKIGSGTPTPITNVTLDDIGSLAGYETTYGPLLIEIANVTGTPKQPAQTFGLGNTYYDGGADDAQIISLSPYYMAGGVFAGFDAGAKTKFSYVSGVYNEYFNPDASAVKYLELGTRTMSDVK